MTNYWYSKLKLSCVTSFIIDWTCTSYDRFICKNINVNTIYNDLIHINTGFIFDYKIISTYKCQNPTFASNNIISNKLSINSAN